MRPFQSWIAVAALLAVAVPPVPARTVPAGASGPAVDATAESHREAPAGPAVEERWYVMELDGRPAGWAVERWWREGDRWITESETSVRLGRDRQELRVRQAGRFVETAAGEPVSLWTRSTLGSAPVEATYRFGSRGVRAVTHQGERELRDVLPAPEGEWLTPAAARRTVRRHHRAGDTDYRVRAVDPLEGPEPVTLTRTRVGPSELPGAEGLWREEVSSAPGVVSLVDLDADGQVLRSTAELLGLDATLRLADRESALAALDAGPGPEVLLGTLVRPDRPLPHPQRLERAVYELSLSRGDADGAASLPELPAAGAQSVARANAGGVRVTVAPRAADPPRAGGGPPALREAPPPEAPEALSPEARSRLLASSPWLDHRDPEIRRLLRRALSTEVRASTAAETASDRDGGGQARGRRERPPDADPLPLPAPEDGAGEDRERARSLERFVHGYLGHKDLGTGFATASEVARSAAGDCTEHSVLLAALLRAAGIPARAVTGLVYLEEFAGARGVFGYHMWVQAHVDGRWLDLDATLPGGFGPTHIALATSELSGPEGVADLERLLPLVGRLQVRVVEPSP